MKKELVDFIGRLLFDEPGKGKKLALRSEKQYQVYHDGSLKEQSVVTTIVVDDNAICLSYALPDGHTVDFVNAITDMSCVLNNDYTVRRIQYKATAGEAAEQEEFIFTLQCDDDQLSFFEESGTEKVLFSINPQKVALA